jgi:hypothetical protein
MAAAIEKQKAEDPATWRAAAAAKDKRIRELETSVAQLAKRPEKIETKLERVEVPVLTAKDLVRLEAALAKFDQLTSRFSGITADMAAAMQPVYKAIQAALNAPPPTTGDPYGRSAGSNGGGAVRAATPGAELHRGPSIRRAEQGTASSPPKRTAAMRSGEPRVTTDGITARQQRFLDAAATLERLGVETTRETVSGWLGVHPRGGSVGEELKALEDADLIVMERGHIAITDAGAAAAGESPAEEAIARAKESLSPRQRRIFDIVVEHHPGDISRDAIAERMGIHPRGGSFGEDLGRLRGRGLLSIDRGMVRARDFLFAGVA